MVPRRALLLALPAGLGACAGGDGMDPLPPLVTGYRHLTPIRLNVAELEIAPPAAGAIVVNAPAPLRPEAEMRLMAEERIVPAGTSGRARFRIDAAEFRRERLPGSGGLAGTLGGGPGERLSVRLAVRLDLARGEPAETGFITAEARRQRMLPAGTGEAARRRAAEEVVRQAMDELNVEFEYQIRRTLRAWLVEAAPPAGAVEREDLPRS